MIFGNGSRQLTSGHKKPIFRVLFGAIAFHFALTRLLMSLVVITLLFIMIYGNTTPFLIHGLPKPPFPVASGHTMPLLLSAVVDTLVQDGMVSMLTAIFGPTIRLPIHGLKKPPMHMTLQMLTREVSLLAAKAILEQAPHPP